MSDQRRAGAVISLEEVFRSREFGRRPARWDDSPVVIVDVSDPPQLEQVFLSELFGHPEAIAEPAPGAAPSVVPSTMTRPALVLLPGRGEAEHDLTRYRGAIGAVSGVAAAALVVAGMSSGTGSHAPPPTISAEGVPPGHGHPLPPPSAVAPVPSSPGPPASPTGGLPGTFAGAAPVANLTSATTPAPAAVVVAVPAPAPVQVVPSPPAPGGGTSPTGPAPAPGGGNVLTPVFVATGTTVSTVGSTVTTASNGLAHVVPAAAPVTGLLSNVGTTVTNLGQSVADA